MKRIISLILLLAMLTLSACGEDTTKDTESPTDTESDTITDADSIGTLDIVKNGLSDYVIVCDYKDSVAKDFANDFWELLLARYGVSLNTKSTSSDGYDKEIIIGNTERKATVAIKAQLAESDFAVCAYGDDLVLYATDEAQYNKMLIALRDVLLPVGDTFSFGEQDNFISSLRSDVIIGGSVVELIKNGKSEYSIVYGSGDTDSMMYAIYLKQYISEMFGITVPISADTKAVDKAIVLKGASDSELKLTEKKLSAADDFTVSVVGDKVVLSATDNEHMVLCMMKLVEMCKKDFDGTSVKLREEDNFIYSKENRTFEYSLKELCERYRSIYNTYSTYHEDKLYNTSWIPQSDKDDQMLIFALVERMREAAVIMNGSSSVLYDGFVRKLDTMDYTRTATVNGNSVKIPKQFAESYFKATLTADANGYVDIVEYLKNNSDYTLYISEDKSLAIITPKGVKSFDDATVSDGKYTNSAYIERMREFFHSKYIPEPNVNTEQSRVVIENVQYPEYALDFKTQEYQTTYSPSIVVAKENGNSVYYVSYEISTVVNYEEFATYTVVKKSVDGGNTWTTVIEKIPDLRWASVFENKGVIYLLGSDLYKESAIIIKIGENGSYKKAELFKKAEVEGTAPGAVLHANGRIYKAYHIASISASEESDLMQPSSWTVSNKTNVASLAQSGGEGSMVQGKDGHIYQVMHTNKTQEAYVLRLSADGKTYYATKPSTGNKVEFPTCISKTSVIYDEVSGKYIALSNICNTPSERQRNILALVVSDDLYKWEIAEYILVEREMINPVYSTTVHAYQYTDFKIDGDDIVMVVREASGYTNTYHDGNYTTFYRLENFRMLLD